MYVRHKLHYIFPITLLASENIVMAHFATQYRINCEPKFPYLIHFGVGKNKYYFVTFILNLLFFFSSFVLNDMHTEIRYFRKITLEAHRLVRSLSRLLFKKCNHKSLIFKSIWIDQKCLEFLKHLQFLKC